MLASIVVVPRERFTSLPVSLRSLFSTIAEHPWRRRVLGKERFRRWQVIDELVGATQEAVATT